MRIKQENQNNINKVMKKFILPEGMEIEAGKFILEAGDEIYFSVPKIIEEDGRKNNIDNFGDKKASNFTKDDAKKDDKEKKEEEIISNSGIEDEDLEFKDDNYKTSVTEVCNKKPEEIEIDNKSVEEKKEESIKTANELLEQSKKRFKESRGYNIESDTNNINMNSNNNNEGSLFKGKNPLSGASFENWK